MTLQTRIKLVFLLQSIAGGAMVTRIPDLQQGLGLSEGELGLVMMGQPLGALFMFLFASRLVERFGTRLSLMVFIPIMAGFLIVQALAASGLILGAGLFGFAAAFALTNVAMNVEADRVEAATGDKVMNKCHGIWSYGFLATSLLGVVMHGGHVPVLYHFGGLFPLVVLATIWLLGPLQASAPRAHKGLTRRPAFAVPTLLTLTLVAFGFAGGMTEMGTRIWSIIYVRDTFIVPAWVESLTLPAFSFFMASARMGADTFLKWTGAVRGVRIMLAIAMLGVLFVVFAPNLYLALTGFAMMGVGVCVLFPLMLSTAAQAGDRPASENVAAVTLVNSLIMLGSPALMGLVAEAFGIRVTFGLLLPILMLSFSVAGVLRLRDQAPRTS